MNFIRDENGVYWNAAKIVALVPNDKHRPDFYSPVFEGKPGVDLTIKIYLPANPSWRIFP
jgi:hypothetical protein